MKRGCDFFFRLIITTVTLFAIHASVVVAGNIHIAASASFKGDSDAAMQRKAHSILKIQEEHRRWTMSGVPPPSGKKPTLVPQQSISKKLPRLHGKNTSIDASTQSVFPDYTFGINGAVSNLINGVTALTTRHSQWALRRAGKLLLQENHTTHQCRITRSH